LRWMQLKTAAATNVNHQIIIWCHEIGISNGITTVFTEQSSQVRWHWLTLVRETWSYPAWGGSSRHGTF
jgi:hypothetical protein